MSLLLFASALLADPCRDGATALERRDLPAAEAALKQCPTVQGHLMLAGVYQLQQNAEALYRTAAAAMKKFPEEKRFYLTAGTHEARRKQYAAAVKTFEQAYSRWPDDPKLKSLLASSHFAAGTELLDAGKNEPAAASLRRAAELAPRDIEALMNLGRALHNMLHHSEALKVFDRALTLNAAFPLVRFHRGMALFALGDFDKAVADLTQEIQANPDYPPARLLRGLAYIANADWERARADLQLASAAMPGNANAQYGYARTLVHTGELAAAEAALTKAMAADPADPAPVNTLVSVLHRLGRSDEARALAPKAAALARAKRTAERGEIRFETVTRK
jgi:tetratricopeptide (TPR) repeat protein